MAEQISATPDGIAMVVHPPSVIPARSIRCWRDVWARCSRCGSRLHLSFFWIFLGGPYVERLRGNRMLAAALSAITAAVVGVMLNLAVWFALHVLFGRVAVIGEYGLHLSVPVLAACAADGVVLARLF